MTKQKQDFMIFVKERKTTYEFSTKQVKEADIKKILEAARWAPSVRNAQPWHFIIVKDKKKIAELMSTASYGDFHTDPPLIIAIAGVEKKDITLAPLFRGNKACAYDTYMSVSMACLDMAYEAKERGLGTCILSPKEKEAKTILRLPKQYALPLLLGVGYQTKEAFQKQRQRNKIETMRSYEYFGGKRR